MKEASVMPWTRGPEDIEVARNSMEALRARPNHVIAEDAYIAPEAQIFTNRLVVGANSWIAADSLLRDDIEMGAHCTVNAKTCISGKVTVGDGVRIASLVTIVGFNHVTECDRPIYQQPLVSEGIVIEDDVWIGANVVICDGVRVGAHSVIAAGAIVVKDVPEYSLVGGNPARVIRDRRHPKRSTVESALDQIGSRAADEWKTVLRSYEVDLDGERIYVDPQQGKPSVRAWCDAIEIASSFGGLPELSSRDALVERLQSFQEAEYGLIMSPESNVPDREALIHLPDGYHFLAVGYALECLGSHVRDEIRAISLLSCDEIYAHLDGLDWTEGGWGCGDWVDKYTTGMYHNLKYHQTSNRPEWIFGWLDSHCDPATGVWSLPSRQQKWLQAVNGFYRLTRGSYAQYGRPLPYPESSIDTILSHCRHNGNFLEKNVNACNVLDIVHPLWLCARQTDYRANEIRSIMEAQLVAISQRWHSNQGFAFDPRMTPGLQGTEMWLSIVAIAADYLGLADRLPYEPRGVHRLLPAYL